MKFWVTWQIFYFFKNIAVATVYTNLGDDAVVHAINETKSSVVVTSQELLPKLHQLLEQVNVISSVVFIHLRNLLSIPQTTLIVFSAIVRKTYHLLRRQFFCPQRFNKTHGEGHQNASIQISRYRGNIEFRGNIILVLPKYIFLKWRWYILKLFILLSQGANILSSNPTGQDAIISPTPQDTAIVMYTSGSTGTPKVCIAYYYNSKWYYCN